MSNLDINELVGLVRAIEHHKGKHLKATLVLLEADGHLDAKTRKTVLDGFNNFNRQILRLLGYNVEK